VGEHEIPGASMTFDSESINDTAKELSLSPAEVERALKVAKAYSKHHQRNKARRIAEREKMLRDRALEELKLAHPERCFCVEEGIDVEHGYDSEVIRYVTRKSFSYIGVWTGEYYDDPVYRCSNCGKEWRMTFAVA
jgi:hypothetical protein